MISIFPYSELGNHNYGWLDAHYHFNFAEYYHPDKAGYPPLIVWNDDCIQPRWENVAINSFHEPGIHILASGEKELGNSNIIKLFQDATLYLMNGEQKKNLDFELKNGRQMYLVVAKGAVMINKNRVNSRDGVFINNENKLDFNFQEDSELLFFDLPEINT